MLTVGAPGEAGVARNIEAMRNESFVSINTPSEAECLPLLKKFKILNFFNVYHLIDVLMSLLLICGNLNDG